MTNRIKRRIQHSRARCRKQSLAHRRKTRSEETKPETRKSNVKSHKLD